MIINYGRSGRRLLAATIAGILIFTFQVAGASENDTTVSHQESEFDPGTMIIEHITDAHEWHILTLGETHVSIP